MDRNDIEKFNCSGSTGEIAARWKRWLRGFECYILSKGLSDSKRKKASLLHNAGLDVQDIYFAIEKELPSGTDEYKEAVKLLTNYFTPEVNIPYERHIFRTMEQKLNETISQFVLRLKQKAQLCDFKDLLNEQLRDQVVEKCKSTELRRKLLEKGKNLTLEITLEIGRILEASQDQASKIENVQTVNHVKRERDGKKCYRCGAIDHLSFSKKCPARNEVCKKCNIIGHHAKYCRTRADKIQKGKQVFNRNEKKWKVRQVEEDNPVEEEYGFMCRIGQVSKNDVDLTITIGGIDLGVLIDSGSTCNIVDVETWEDLKSKKIKCKTEKVKMSLNPYGEGNKLNVKGKFTALVKVGNGQMLETEFYVTEEKGIPLLSRETSIELGILRVGKINHINKFSEDIFKGLGKIKDVQVKIPVRESISPVIQPLRRIPVNLQDKLEVKIKELEDLDVIEKVDGPTSWCSQVVVVPKRNGEIRLCVDMRRVNEAIERERFNIPTLQDLLCKLKNAKLFSKLDIKWAFHQIELHPDSRPLTTFQVNTGLYQYKRLLFGISNAPELFQKIMQQIMSSCRGVFIYIDDILVYGEDQTEHDNNLTVVIKVLSEKGIKLNKDKSLFSVKELQFLGHVLTDKGIRMDRSKKKIIEEFRKPESKEEIRSLLGLLNFVGRYVPNLSTLTDPLRAVCKSDKYFWEMKQQQAFEGIKKSLCDKKTLAYYDSRAQTKVVADASPVGLGSVLVQVQDGNNRVIEYASKSLSEVEKRYSQTEKEALALVWACEKFQIYLLGKEFELITDHKPLEFIFSPRSKPSLRIERWVLRLQSFWYKVVYSPGKNNIADVLSRLPRERKEETFDEFTNYWVRQIVEMAKPKAANLEEIKEVSETDEEIAGVREALKTGNFGQHLKSYQIIQEELCVTGALVLRGTRLLIPKKLRKLVLNKTMTPFSNNPCTVVEKHGSQIVVETPSSQRKVRNSTAVKPYVSPQVEETIPKEEDGIGVEEIIEKRSINLPAKYKDFVM